jgi:hypothetical protein
MPSIPKGGSKNGTKYRSFENNFQNNGGKQVMITQEEAKDFIRRYRSVEAKRSTRS